MVSRDHCRRPAQFSLSIGIFAVIIFAQITTYGTVSERTLKTISIAVLQPDNLSGVTRSEARLIADRLRIELFNTGRVTVMEREEMYAILKEQGFQQSGACSEESCVAEAGQLLGVEAMIGGSIGRLGSVYMINFRVIDVSTGKLIAAVSRDINGNIEELIGLLSGIAGDLSSILSGFTGMSAAQSGAHSEQTVQVAPATANPNRNRRGVRLHAGTHWGNPVFFLNEKEYAPAKYNTFGPGYKETSIFKNGPLWHIDLSYLFRAGPYLVISLGPAFQWFDAVSVFESAVNDHSSRIEYFFGNAGQHAGISYVKRILPWKINAGVFYDLGYCWWSSKIDSVDSRGRSVEPQSVLGLSEEDMTNFAWSLGHGVGFQGGMEYVVNGRFGINLDFYYRFLQPVFQFSSTGFFSLQSNKDRHIKILTDYNGWDDHPSFSVILPMFGFALGVNWYF